MIPPAAVPDPLVAVVDAIFDLYGAEAVQATDALTSGAAELWLRFVTEFHLRKRDRSSGRAEADAVIARFRALIARAAQAQ